MADNITVGTTQDLVNAALTVKPGDTILLADGTYRNLRLSVNTDGTNDKMITIKAQNPGKAYISGNSAIELRGDYIHLSGLYFKDGSRNPGEWKTHGPGIVSIYADHCEISDCLFYDFDKATLRPDSKVALDEMIKVLNDNPNVTIELGAHTDRKGTDQYNERLAQRRAQSVVDYLIAGGIAADRLEAKGYGESVPKTINKKMAREFDFLKEGDVLTEEFILNLTPEQQEIADQINRRTEFKVLRTNYNLF